MPKSWNIQYDAQGRPFIDQPGGSGPIYISPAAFGQPTPKDTSGFFGTRPEFNQQTGNFESGTNWGNILSLVVAGVITAGVATALMSGAAPATVVSPEVLPQVSTAVATDTAAGSVPLSTQAATTLASSATGPGFVAPITATASTLPESATVAGAVTTGTGTAIPSASGGPGAALPTDYAATTGGAGGAGQGVVTASTNLSTAGAAANWLKSPVFSGVVNTAGQLFAAKIQSDATKAAAATQAASTQAALDWEKQRYANVMGSLQPYIAAGTTAADREAQLLGLPPRTGTTATPGQLTPSGLRPPAPGAYQGPGYGGTPAAPTAPAPAAAVQRSPTPAAPAAVPVPGAAPTTATVTLQAPDGSTRQVPAGSPLIAQATAKGAKVVG